MQRDDSVYLKHIRDAIRKIGEYTKGVSRSSFQKNSLIQDAVIHQIEIIGEATKRLSDAVRTSYPDVPWQDIAGTRDKLVTITLESTLRRFGSRYKPISPP